MDPKATWQQLVQAWTTHEWETVSELAEALQHWINRHGVPPETIPGTRVGYEWNRTVVLAVCELAIGFADRVLADPNGIPAGVPFSLSCTECDTDGPASFVMATKAGWTRIRFTPEAIAENFFGLCPQHSASTDH